jgi:VCBS repeat-containing protein
MNLLNSIYHQILSGCLLFTLGLGMTNPIAVVPIAGHFQEPTLVDAEMIGYVQRNLPPDIGGVIPSVIMSGNPPVANNDALEVNEDDIATLLVSGETSVLFNDSDDEGDTLTATLHTDAAFGDLVLAADGTFSYDHDGTETVNDSFVYNADDGTSIVTATVFITITLLNDAPVAYDDSLYVEEGLTTTLLLNDVTSVLENDTDEEFDPLTATLGIDPSFGTVFLDPTGTFTYTHNGSENHADFFTYSASDGEFTDVATVTVTITPTNDAPDAIDDYISVDEDGVATLLDSGASSVQENDLDPDTTTLTITLDTDVSNGDLILNEDGTFSYDHDGSETTTDSFIYIADDGEFSDTATVTIAITPTNDAPDAIDDYITVEEDGVVTLLDSGAPSVQENDLDPDTTTLTISLDTDVSNGDLILNEDGTFSYDHDGSETTSDSFVYVADDGELTDTATVHITITPVNDPPVADDDFLTVSEGGTANVLDSLHTSVLFNDLDPDSILTATVEIPPEYSSFFNLDPTGTFTYTHNGSENHVDSFTYIASDGEFSDTAVVTITVTNENDHPVALPDSAIVDEGDTITVLEGNATSVLDNDYDPDGDVTLTASLDIKPEFGTLTLNPDGTFIYTHDSSENHTDTFRYVVSDGQLADFADVTIKITPINDPPIAVNDFYTTKKGTILEVQAPGVLENDSDAENEDLSVTAKTFTRNGQVTLNEDGSFIYSPLETFSGENVFLYEVCDPHDDCVDATVTISVTLVNAAPVALGDHYYTDVGQMLSVPVDLGLLANDSDAETDKFSLITSQETDVSKGKLALNNNGSFTYTPPEDYIGTVSFTYKAYDGDLYSNVATVMIAVGEDNEPPIISWISPSIDEDTWIDVGTQIYPLEVKVLDNVEVALVNFRRWEPSAGTNGDWVYLGSVSSSPFRLDLDTSTINLGFNQITAEAYDSSNNFSESNIFLRRWGGLIHMPIVSFNSD